MARRPGLRLRHRGRRRAHVDDRLPRPEPDLAVLRRRLERRHPRRSAGCSSRWSTVAAPARASWSRRRWSMPRSTSPPSRSSSTRPTAPCSSATGTGARPPRPRTCTWPPTSTRTGERDAWVAIAVATDDQWLALREATRRPGLGDGPDARRRGRTPAGARRHRRHLSTWCEQRSGDEIVDRLWAAGVPVAKVMQPHEQADPPPAAAPRLLRGGRAPRRRDGPPQHPAVPVVPRPRAVPPPPRAAAGRAHRRGAARARRLRRRAGRAARDRRDRRRARHAGTR